MSLNTSGQRRTLAETICNEIDLSLNSPPKHYFTEVERLKNLARTADLVEIDGEQAYLENWGVARVLSDQWIFHAWYVVAAHGGAIQMRGVCTPDALVYDLPDFIAPKRNPRIMTALPIKYRRP